MKQFIKKGCIFVNGVLLSPEAIDRLDHLQTGGTVNLNDWNERVFSNENLEEQLSDISVIERHFQKLMVEDDDEVPNALKMLRILADVRWILDGLRLPA